MSTLSRLPGRDRCRYLPVLHPPDCFRLFTNEKSIEPDCLLKFSFSAHLRSGQITTPTQGHVSQAQEITHTNHIKEQMAESGIPPRAKKWYAEINPDIEGHVFVKAGLLGASGLRRTALEAFSFRQNVERVAPKMVKNHPRFDYIIPLLGGVKKWYDAVGQSGSWKVREFPGVSECGTETRRYTPSWRLAANLPGSGVQLQLMAFSVCCPRLSTAPPAPRHEARYPPSMLHSSQ